MRERYAAAVGCLPSGKGPQAYFQEALLTLKALDKMRDESAEIFLLHVGLGARVKEESVDAGGRTVCQLLRDRAALADVCPATSSHQPGAPQPLADGLIDRNRVHDHKQFADGAPKDVVLGAGLLRLFLRPANVSENATRRPTQVFHVLCGSDAGGELAGAVLFRSTTLAGARQRSNHVHHSREKRVVVDLETLQHLCRRVKAAQGHRRLLTVIA